MSDAKTKIFAVLKILLAMVLCAVVSLVIYLIAVPFIFGAWHCPHPPCSSPDWIQWTVFLILASPLLVFACGAYLCRAIIKSLTESKIFRVLVFSGFALSPVFLLIGLVFYIINSK